MIYLIGTLVFSSVIMLLVGLLLLVEAKVVLKGDRSVVINDDADKILQTQTGTSLLKALANNDIFIPSACGGGGSCGMCKCKIEAGVESYLPTELAHINRMEKQANIHLACQLKVKQDLKIRIPEDILEVKKYHATVVSNDNVATFIKDLVLELDADEPLVFNAGAYVQLDIPEYELSFSEFRKRVGKKYQPAWDRFDLWGLRSKSEEAIFRAYSLANPPSENRRLRFTIRIATPPPGTQEIPPGKGSSFIFNLNPGDKITLSGPYGEFFVKGTQREMCFVGGGAGMAPLRSQVMHYLETIPKLGNSTSGDLADTLGVTRPSVSAIIKKLIDNGYLTKSKSKIDGRVYYLHLTEKGIRFNELHREVHQLLARRITENLKKEEIGALADLLGKLTHD